MSSDLSKTETWKILQMNSIIMESMKRMRMTAKRQVRHAATAHTPNVAIPETSPVNLCVLVLASATQLQFTYSCTEHSQQGNIITRVYVRYWRSLCTIHVIVGDWNLHDCKLMDWNLEDWNLTDWKMKIKCYRDLAVL